MTPGDVVADRFLLEERAGSGGAGSVYRAVDRSTGNPVAVKILHALPGSTPERFLTEAQVLSQLRHPAIVGYVTHGLTAGEEPFLVMEWLAGQDLAQRLARGPLSVEDTLSLALRAAEALAHAHAHGVVHRDVKPSNLFLAGGELGRIKLLDFGIARITDGHRATRAGAILGTPGYMAPEQARGSRNIDARADVFALGCVLFECITGRPAFGGDHAMAILSKVLFDDAPLDQLETDAPPGLRGLLTRMLTKDAAARPADGAALVRELSALALPRPFDQPPMEARTAAALTTHERRLMSVVVLGAAPSAAEASDALREAGRKYGARVEVLLDGSAVATLFGGGAATDQATRAARCALALRVASPFASIAVAMGRGEIGEHLPAGDVIDRAVRLLGDRTLHDPTGTIPISLDDVTAGLLDARFDTLEGASGFLLLGERENVDVGRRLAGRESVCVGRDRELSMLDAIYDEVEEESKARLVLVLAAAGMGKSRLRQEFTARLEKRESAPRMLLAGGDPVTAGSPFGMVCRVLAKALGMSDADGLATRRAKLRARVASTVEADRVARVTEFLAELMGTPLEGEPSLHLRAARRDARLMGDQMQRAWEDFIAAECKAGPLVIVLDDLQWGDLPSIRFIDGALKNLGNRALLVLALARPDFEETFHDAWSDRHASELRLAPLTRSASEKLVTAALGAGAPPKTIGSIVSRAAGNAFFLEELVRSAAAGHVDAFPETVLAMVQARLERLAPETRRVLRAASIFGQSFSRNGVSALLGTTEDPELAARLGELVEKEYLVHRDAEQGALDTFAFVHAFVHQAAYGMLTDEDRTLGHRVVGEWLADRGLGDPFTLARHFELAGQQPRARAWYRRAAEQALEGNDLAQAIGHADRAHQCGAEGSELGLLWLLQAQSHRWMGAFVEALRAAEEALRLLPERSPESFTAAGEAAIASSKLGEVERLASLGENLATACRVGRGGEALVIASMRAATYLFYAGRRTAAMALLSVAEAYASQLDPEPGVLGWSFVARATRAEFDGSPGEYLALTEEAARCFERAGDLRNACTHRLNVGYASMELGDFAAARSALEDALVSADRMGLPNLVAVAKHNLGLTLGRLGRLEEAARVEREAIGAFEVQGDSRMAAASRAYLADILAAGGDLSSAETEARAAVSQLADGAPVRALALATLSRVLLAVGRAGEALAEADRAMNLLGSLKGIEEGESLVRLALAEALYASGDVVRARAEIGVAARRLLARAERISEPTRRAGFLGGIPENARTLALAEQWR